MPEVEEGNIEYKLKLTHISPARFARLVTQLKWRLLEGGGQAYYELGVADSGALIGLYRTDLEASLDTLDRMAGEIGASVIVVKEIEVPPAMYALADEASRYIDPRTGEWSGRMHARRRGGALAGVEDDSTATETTETEAGTELDTTDADDDDDTSWSPSAFISALATPADSSPAPGIPIPASFAHRLSTHPNRPSPQSSPYIAPFDDDLAMFSMEPEPPHLDIDDGEDAPPVPVLAPVPFVVDLEIAAVYKPRPFKRSEPVPGHTGPRALHGRAHRRAKYDEKEAGKTKKVHSWQAGGTVPTKGKGGSTTETGTAPDGSSIIPNREETKAALRREARERRREEKRRALLAASGLVLGPTAGDGDILVDPPQPVVTVSITPPTTTLADNEEALAPGDDLVALDTVTEDLVSGLGSLHVSVDASLPADGELAVDLPSISVDKATVAEGADTITHVGEPRLIVEALVVRKQSLEEAFVEFGGFQLI
ncbi:hypothetical protein FOMPIDRAFT_162655 [Fomitopsis schrenkii]|uniref:Uncharacterized protein n=1 Tax=Fomitopsis schrenkii TaxID=2126942 RepID=S8DI89_FOMSC|nr:hypothetical protein FOMPIDRAFT_162655 [Fomitopsis schrenkii]